MTTDELIVTTVGSVAGLNGKVYPYTALKDASAPFCFYLQTSESEEEVLEGLSGLKSAEYEIHVVAATQAAAQLLGAAAMKALQDLAQTDSGDIHVGRSFCKMTAPIVDERDVGMWRKPLLLHLDYTKESA